jgi:metal-responsive CopG/Arc/MetJ family transcriptional regulator
MFGAKIKVDKELYERLKEVAGQKGYASVEEFIRDVLEKAAASAEDETDEELARKQLQGLGYLD